MASPNGLLISLVLFLLAGVEVSCFYASSFIFWSYCQVLSHMGRTVSCVRMYFLTQACTSSSREAKSRATCVVPRALLCRSSYELMHSLAHSSKNRHEIAEIAIRFMAPDFFGIGNRWWRFFRMNRLNRRFMPKIFKIAIVNLQKSAAAARIESSIF